MLRKYLIILIVGCGLLIIGPVVFAQDDLAGSSPESTVDELDGIVLDIPSELPSDMGLWWRGIKERFQLATTFDPIKKEELYLKFAEERLKLAELIIDKSDNPEVQDKVKNMVERAQQLMIRVEEHKDILQNNPDERVARLLTNIATHQVRREAVMDKIEEKMESKLSDEQMENLRELRERGVRDSHRLLNAIDNEKIPEKVRAHLQNIKARIEEHADSVEEFQGQQKELIGAVKSGDESAKEQLQKLWEERKQKMEEIREEFKSTDIPNTSAIGVVDRIKERTNRREDSSGETNEAREGMNDRASTQ